MTDFKFKPEDFDGTLWCSGIELALAEPAKVFAAKRANELLEAHLNTLKKVYCLHAHGVHFQHWREADYPSDTHEALLYRVKQIEK